MIYGPFTVRDMSATPSVQIEDGVEIATYPPAEGVHYTATPDAMTAYAELLTPYRVYPVAPLQYVMAGDPPDRAPWVIGDAASGAWNTIPLRFPDQTTADATVSAMVGDYS